MSNSRVNDSEMDIHDRTIADNSNGISTSSTSKKRNKKKGKKKKNMALDEMEIDQSDHPHHDETSDEKPILEEQEDEITETYIPGRSRALMEDEELVMDKSSYRLFHELQVESACLSFDILLDNMGSDRVVDINGSAISACLIAGTQALHDAENKLVVMRLSNMNPFHRKIRAEEDEDDDSDSEDDSSSDEDDLDTKPELDAATIEHKGTANRIRAHRFGGRYLAASWSELGTVSVWDLTRPLTAVNDSAVMSEYFRHGESPKPLYTHKAHRTEGFALDWSSHPSAAGHLATGDCDGRIYHWTPRPTGWAVSRTPYTGHTGSVEDIQWSNTEPTVFISVSADRSIRVWDTRSPSSHGSMLTVPEAHPADVNVASWSHLQPVSLLTGGDEGSLRIWDLRLIHRHFSSASGSVSNSSVSAAYTHMYEFHTAPITSVEWHPTDAGVFVATSEDNQVTLWDNTLEQDADKDDMALDTVGESKEDMAATNNLPVQLLFIHCGQTEIKEAHWHPQLPGLLVVTSLEGFNVFRTCNV